MASFVMLSLIPSAGCKDTLLVPATWPPVVHPRGENAPVLVMALAAQGDIVAAGLDGGVALWDLSSGMTRRVTRMDGLPSGHVAALALDWRAEMLLAATRSGLARGFWEGSWESLAPGQDLCDRTFTACTSRPGGGWVAGSANGLLAAWTWSRVDTLRLPRRTRIVGVAHASRLLEPSVAADRGPGPLDAPVPELVAPGLVPGLVVASAAEGLWLLRSTGSRVRWLELGPRDGLPEAKIRAIAADGLGRAWVATEAGVARVGPGIECRSWPADSLLGLPAWSLLYAPDGWMYAGLADGIMRIDAREESPSTAPFVERVAGSRGRALALAWAGGTLWWTNGIRVFSLTGRELDPAESIPERLTRCGSDGRVPACSTGASRHRRWRRGKRAALARCVRGPRPSLLRAGASGVGRHEFVVDAGSRASIGRRTPLRRPHS